MPVKAAEMSSWRRVERVGEVAVGGCWASGAVVLAIDIFVRVVGGKSGRSKLASHSGGTFSQRDTHFRLSYAVPQHKLQAGLEVLTNLLSGR